MRKDVVPAYGRVGEPCRIPGRHLPVSNNCLNSVVKYSTWIEYLNEDTFEILESSELKNCQMVKNIKFLFQLYL